MSSNPPVIQLKNDHSFEWFNGQKNLQVSFSFHLIYIRSILFLQLSNWKLNYFFIFQLQVNSNHTVNRLKKWSFFQMIQSAKKLQLSYSFHLNLCSKYFICSVSNIALFFLRRVEGETRRVVKGGVQGREGSWFWRGFLLFCCFAEDEYFFVRGT